MKLFASFIHKNLAELILKFKGTVVESDRRKRRRDRRANMFEGRKLGNKHNERILVFTISFISLIKYKTTG